MTLTSFRSTRSSYSTPVSLWIILICTSLILGSLIALFTDAYKKRLTEEIYRDAAYELSANASALSSAIESRLLLSNGLKAFAVNELRYNDEINPLHFTTFASQFIGKLKGIRNLSIYPDGVAAYVYPLADNESLLGLNLFTHTDESVRNNAFRSKLTDDITVLGPVELAQGGIGLLSRQSIYEGDQFWGFVSVVLDITPILQEADLFDAYKGIDFAIRGNGRNILGNSEMFTEATLLEQVDLMENEGYWEMTAIPRRASLESIDSKVKVIQMICAFTLLLILYFLYIQLTQKAKLQALVKERTRNLERAETELRGQLHLLENKEQTVRHMAYHDTVTGLTNRTYFNEHLGQLIAESKESGLSLALLFLDLDHFKLINDTLGHIYGDILLKEVGRRLSWAMSNGESISRIGGDEFTIIVPNVASTDYVRGIAIRVRELFQHPFVLKDTEYFVTTSIGVALYPDDGLDDTTLIRNADLAMYRAKEEGKNQYRFYDRTMFPEAEETMEMKTSLRKALERNEFLVHYQPQIDILTGKMIGLEALIRWNHPKRGLIPPNSFIPIAEETGLIVPIGEKVLQLICAQSKAWQQAGYSPIRIAVNLSARQFGEKGLARRIKQIVDDHQLSPSDLELEITENMAMKDDKQVVLQELRDMGFTISIDDFGTQYSSLAYLKKLPINRIKIDRSFVGGIARDNKDEAIILAMLLIANRLNLTVIAEGVETSEQLSFLQDNHCHEIQGFIFHRPQPAEAVERLLVLQSASLELK